MTATPLYIPGSAGEYFGRVLQTRRAGRFVFRESRYGPALRMPSHYHPRAYFSYIAGGGIRERDRRAEREYAVGSVHFHPAGEPHSGQMGTEGATCMSIILAGEFPERVRTSLAVRPHDPVWHSASQLARKCHWELQTEDSASELALEALALELITIWSRGHAPRERTVPVWLLEVRDHLHAHYLERVRLAELSVLADIHEVHLVRAFRRRFGATPGAYVRRLRVEHGRRALLDSDAPIADLALAAGFSSQAHFTRVFNRLVGATPASYRRTHQGRGS